MANNNSSLLEEEKDWDAVIKPFLYTDAEIYLMYIFLPIVVLTGLIGNASTIIVLTTNTRMGTPLNIYLVNLAISDSLFLVVASTYMWFTLTQSPFHIFYDNRGVSVGYCKFNALVVDWTYMVSANIVLAISVERFLAITKPLKYRSYVSKKRTIKVCCAIWIISLICQVRNTVTIGKQELTFSWPDMWNGVPSTSSVCVYCSVDEFNVSVCSIIVDLVTAEVALYLVYLMLMITLYLVMIVSLYQPLSKKKQEISSASNRTNYERKALNTVIVTVVVYVVLTAPNNMLWIYGYIIPKANYDVITSFANVFRYLAFVNNSVNPIIYNISNDRYRKRFLQLFGFSSGTVNKENCVQTPARTPIFTISTSL
ncbi:neuromedin-U receptor 1-like [Anneissia japonica]|uniref:neuromedin-U receptor 1-like n=1 Tax=Anneissia japonica TaxID=1529436 RepID=UPI001425B5D2|nr:neuromedin-U receptor 1-like [Anneissia japonica]